MAIQKHDLNLENVSVHAQVKRKVVGYYSATSNIETPMAP